jgi:hypothetical protein
VCRSMLYPRECDEKTTLICVMLNEVKHLVENHALIHIMAFLCYKALHIEMFRFAQHDNGFVV